MFIVEQIVGSVLGRAHQGKADVSGNGVGRYDRETNNLKSDYLVNIVESKGTLFLHVRSTTRG